jgi:hypothetical protein
MGVTDFSRNVYKYKMVDWKRDEGVGEEYGTTSINILVSTRQKYVVITCGKNA